MSRYIIAIIFGFLLISGSAFATTSINLEVAAWKTSVIGDPAPVKEVPLNYTWASSKDLVKVNYQSTFDLAVTSSKVDELFMIIPPIWCNNKVIFNDVVIDSTLVSNIYSSQIIRIPGKLMTGSNTLNLELFGNSTQCKVRGEAVTITNDSKTILKQQIKNLFFNDIHKALNIINVMLFAFCLFFLSIKELKQPMIALMISMVAQIPHNLLTGDLYNLYIKSADPTIPFSVQLAFQCIEWPMAGFFYYLTMFRKTPLPNSRYLSIISTIILGGLATASLILINTTAFHVAFNLLISLSLAYFIGLFFLFPVNRFVSVIYLMSLGAFACSAISELMGLNLYFMGHGWLIMNFIGLYLIFSKLKHSYFLSVIGNNIIAKFIPASCYKRIYEGIELQIKNGKRDDNLIVGQAAGKGFISTILIDICDWGILSSFSRSHLQPKLIYRARLKTFSEIEKIAQKFGVDLIKSQGDNLKYSYGLYCNNEDREHLVADKSLHFIVELIDSIDRINSSLRTDNLPYFEIKISASMGSSEYGIEQYLDRIQFDTIGDEVNIAYRLESAMDQEFYDKFGKNVALVHESLLANCSDPAIIEKFTTPFIVQDKHKGYQYPCLVHFVDKREVRLGDLTQQLGNFFVPTSENIAENRAEPAIAALVNTAIISEPKTNVLYLNNREKRSIARQNSYVGENVIVDLVIGARTVKAEIIDFSPQNIGVIIKKEACDLDLIENQEIEVRFEILEQNFVSKGLMVRIAYDVKIRDMDFINIGIKLTPAERVQAERSFNRFTAKTDFYPTATAQSPFSFRNHISFKIGDISSEGLALIPLDTNSHGLLVGLNLNLTIFVPLVDKFDCLVKICHVSVKENKQVIIGIKVLDNKDKFKEAMGMYLLDIHDDNISFAKLRDDGFSISETKQVLSFSYKQTEGDLTKIAHLRKGILEETKEWAYGDNVEHALDTFDQHSRHIMLFHKERLVAAARVVFNDGDKNKIEHSSYNAEIPNWLLEKKFIEFSRICIDKDYRNSDVFIHLLYHVAKVTMESGHDWGLMSCHSRLMNHYKRFGFQQIGTFKSSDNRTWILGACNLRAAIDGSSFLPLGYALGFEALSEQLREQGVMDQSLYSVVNSRLMKTLKPMIVKKYRKLMKVSQIKSSRQQRDSSQEPRRIKDNKDSFTKAS